MRFTFTRQQEEFRSEVREYLQKEIPKRWKELGYQVWEESDESLGITKTRNRKLGQKGWQALTWPREYGVRAHTN